MVAVSTQGWPSVTPTKERAFEKLCDAGLSPVKARRIVTTKGSVFACQLAGELRSAKTQ